MASGSRNRLLEIAERLKEARQAKFATAAEAARALNMNPITVRAHESGQNGIPADAFADYCHAYDVTPNWLMRGTSLSRYEFDRVSGLRLPVVGIVKAGSYVEDATASLRETERNLDIPGANDTLAGMQIYQIQDNHAEPQFSDGTHVFVVPGDQIRLRDGDAVLVQKTRAGLKEITVRRLAMTEGTLSLSALDGSNHHPLTEAELVIGVITAAYTLVQRPPMKLGLDDVPTVASLETPLETISGRHTRANNT
ncbi:helix-turn-helix domain-containing protein [Caulobacter sp. S45]|uniref:helix-turn-helix domain-containing protein n=1 Tax=Caulobacter sp. S45 TaxID=1641861 RepID=UPI00131D7D7F|nr:helix-turn-helix domain-containing protein [Caulobacter sp. S45]